MRDYWRGFAWHLDLLDIYRSQLQFMDPHSTHCLLNQLCLQLSSNVVPTFFTADDCLCILQLVQLTELLTLDSGLNLSLTSHSQCYYRRSVGWTVLVPGLWLDFYNCQLRFSLTRGRVCRVQLLLGLASVVILGSKPTDPPLSRHADHARKPFSRVA